MTFEWFDSCTHELTGECGEMSTFGRRLIGFRRDVHGSQSRPTFGVSSEVHYRSENSICEGQMQGGKILLFWPPWPVILKIL